MAFDYQLFTVIGRLTRPPEVRVFGTATKASFGLATAGERRKNEQGQWEEKPVFFDCEAWNREYGMKMADFVAKWCKKGTRVFLTGRFKREAWTDKATGQERQAVKLTVESIVLCDGGRPADPEPDADRGDGDGYDSNPGGGDQPAEHIPF